MIQVQIQMIQTLPNWLSQWLTLKLLGITNILWEK